ncbi:CHAT domain-containing protein [Cyathus striatus]|nr:CHAT domain-containing protein [Cyathus striatus]
MDQDPQGKRERKLRAVDDEDTGGTGSTAVGEGEAANPSASPAPFTSLLMPGSPSSAFFQEVLNRPRPPGANPGPVAQLRPGASANEILQSLRDTFQTIKSNVQTHSPHIWNMQQPTSTLPTFRPVQEQGVTPGSTFRPAEVLNRFSRLFDTTSDMFELLDKTQNVQTRPAQHTFSPMSSAPSTSEVPRPPQPVLPHERFLNGAAHIASLANSKTTTSLMTNTFTRSYQNDERLLRSSLKQLASYLPTTPRKALVTWEKEHIDSGVLTTSLALSTPIENPMDAAYAMPTVVRNWSYGQRLLVQNTGDSDKLTIAVDLLEQTFNTVNDTVPPITKRLLHTELACCLYERYLLLQDLANLNASIEHFQTLCEGEYLEPHMHCYLGHAHLQRYLAFGNLDDLDRAWYHASSAGIPTTDSSSGPGTDPDTASGLHLSALCLEHKFHLQLDFVYLDKAIEKCHAAIQLLTENHPLYGRYKSDLAILFILRFESTEEPADLEMAREEILMAIGGDKPERNTQVPLRVTWGMVQVISGEDVDEGIRLISKARKEFAGPGYIESIIEEYFSRAILHRYQTSKSEEDLDVAIKHTRLAFSKALETAPRRAELAVELGRQLMTAYELEGLTAYRDEAIRHFSWAARASSARPTVRFQAATEWANAAEECQSETYIDALACGLDLLPALAWVGNRMPVQYRMLSSQSSTLASRAAAYAIGKGELHKAVSYLEMGRNVLWSQALQFRVGGKEPKYREGLNEGEFLAGYISRQVHDDMHDYNPEEIRERVDRLPLEVLGSLQSMQGILHVIRQRMVELNGEEKVTRDLGQLLKLKEEFGDVYDEASLHHAAARWEALRKNLQSLGDALSTRESLDWLGDEQFVKLLEQGPVVIINAYNVDCDALVISCAAGDRTATLRHVPLPEMSGDLALAWAETLREGVYDFGTDQILREEFEGDVLIPVLQGLWQEMVLPIIDSLRKHGELKERVWWYPTGALTFLPIHAAGPYENSEPGLQELLASSYTPTLNSLVRACKAADEPLHFLAVGMPATSDLAPLSNVKGELAAIQKHFDSQLEKLTILTSEDATVYKVSNALLQHTWLHFACHADQNDEYPFHSAFFMHDGPLRLSKLMRLDLTRVQFAYLSACLTAAGDAALPDECIHLAAGMQFSGVRSLIATMWSVYDEIAVRTTRRVYHHLFKRNPDAPDVGYTAKALQLAVLDMKRNKIPLAYRVAFIHTGI